MKYFSLFFACLCALSCVAQDASPVLGKWKTIDDETGRVKSVVDITERDGLLYGTVIELFRLPEEDQHPICSDCEDDRKDQPALGMEIVRDMVQSENMSEWEDGTICDPKNGKIYDCEMWLDEDDSDLLMVRGYIFFLYRTQKWLRAED
tara:strand:+ start:4883 stop:5329 length:447 start_codon:yes stop_codon:yes gene_type:complete